MITQAGEIAARLVAETLPADAAQHLAAVVIARLEEELVGLDTTAAGRALNGFGAWLTGAGPQVARAIGRSPVLGRPNKGAQAGCAIGGAIITSIGATLLADRWRDAEQQ